MKKYASCALRACFSAFLVFAIFLVVRVAIVHLIYPTLQDWFPNLFHTYNAITDKEKIAEVNKRINFVSAAVSFFIMPFLEKQYDNSRFEYIVDKTYGFYRLKDGFSVYMKSYLFADITALLLAPAPYIPLLLIKLPKRLDRVLGFLLTPLEPFSAVADVTGLVGAYFTIALIALLALVPATFTSLKRWRGLWLAEIE